MVFLANITQQRIRIFQDAGEHWQELVQYGKQGPILRLLYLQKRVHYDKIIVKERWEKEQEQREEERQRRQDNALQRKEYGQCDGSEKDADSVKTRTVLRSKEKARQRKAKAAAKRRRIERRRLVINFREIDLTEEDADLIDEEDVDLLLEVAQSNPVNLEEYQEELCKEGCSEEQAKVMAQVLLGATPWESLGVDHTATEQECTTNFRKISRWIHPDKCTHPKAAETFKKLAEAHEWSKDKVQWEAKQAQSAARKQWVDSQMQAWNVWVATGGNVFSIRTDEALC